MLCRLYIAALVATTLCVATSAVAPARPLAGQETAAYGAALLYWADRGEYPTRCLPVHPTVVVGAAGVPEDALAFTKGCRITIDGDSLDVADDYEGFCNVVVHELGHVLGHPHTDDQNDVMYGGPLVIEVPQCEADRTADGERAYTRWTRWETATSRLRARCRATRSTTCREHLRSRSARHPFRRLDPIRSRATRTVRARVCDQWRLETPTMLGTDLMKMEIRVDGEYPHTQEIDFRRSFGYGSNVSLTINGPGRRRRARTVLRFASMDGGCHLVKVRYSIIRYRRGRSPYG